MSASEALSFDLDDLKKVERMWQKVQGRGGRVQKAVNKASSKAAQTIKRSVKAGAPVRTGALKRNIVIRAEKAKRKGKKVRQVTIKGGAEANEIFQKPIKVPGALGGKNKKAYYPASQEYGFLARAPGGGTQYIPGKYFMREGADAVSAQTESAMIDTVMKELEKIWTEQTG